MKLTVMAANRLRAELTGGPLVIESASPEHSYSPLHMVASGLAVCTIAVLRAWAAHANLPTDALAVEVSWVLASDPHRVGAYAVSIAWPALPPARHDAARRVAEHCTVHATLSHPPSLTIALAT